MLLFFFNWSLVTWVWLGKPQFFILASCEIINLFIKKKFIRFENLLHDFEKIKEHYTIFFSFNFNKFLNTVLLYQ